MKRVLVSLLVVAASFAAPAAHADPEFKTIDCQGGISTGALLTPGHVEPHGWLSCSLGSGSTGSGFSIYDTFTTTIVASIDNDATAPAASFTTGTIDFGRALEYTLYFEDVATAGSLVMANTMDSVSTREAVPYQYHVRAGFITPVCLDCVHPESFTGVNIAFYAEYVYDLPVT